MFVLPLPLPAPTRPFATRRDYYRRLLTDIRVRYLALLDSLCAESWRVSAPAAAWTVGEQMVHLYLRLATLPAALNAIRMGAGYLALSPYMKEHATYWKTKTSAPLWTHRTLAVAYDDAYTRAIAALETVGAEEWTLSATIWGEPDTTVEALFFVQNCLFARCHHDIRIALGQ